jgi:hypothetical protein
LRLFAARDPAAYGVSESLEKIRGAAASERVPDDSRDGVWINWIGLGGGWNAKQYREKDD